MKQFRQCLIQDDCFVKLSYLTQVCQYVNEGVAAVGGSVGWHLVGKKPLSGTRIPPSGHVLEGWEGVCLWAPAGARKITATCSRSVRPTDRTPEAKRDSSINIYRILWVMSLLSPVLYFSQKKTTSKLHLACASEETQESSNETHLRQILTADRY